MEEYVISIGIWGGTFCLFLQYLSLAYMSFDLRYSRMFFGIVTALILCVIESTLAIFYTYTKYGQPEKLIVGIFFGLSWFFMIQVVTWLYVLRIDSLGKYMTFDKCVWYTPYILGVFELMTMVGIIMHAADFDNSVYIYTSVAFTVMSIVIEVFMTVLLLRKLRFILEYRKELLQRIVNQIYFTCAIIVIIEIIIVVMKLTGSSLDFPLRPFVYLIRTYVVIQFYDELITGVQFGSSNEGLSGRNLSNSLDNMVNLGS